MIQGKLLKFPVSKSSRIIPTVTFSVLFAVYDPEVAAKTRLATVPMLTELAAESEKLRFVLPPAAMAAKFAVPVLIVIPVVEQLRVAEPVGEVAAPLLLIGMVMLTVSPGSRRPLLFPLGSLTVILPNAREGALKL